MFINGNHSFSEDQIVEESGLKNRVNTKILGVYLWLALYNAADDSVFSKDGSSDEENWMQRDFGEPPAYFNSSVLEEDSKRIREFYIAHGYYHAKVSSNLFFNHDSSVVEIEFEIDEGRPYMIDVVRYYGIEKIRPQLKENLIRSVDVEVGDVFSNVLMSEARGRIEDFFRNEGYFFINRDSIYVVVDTANFKSGLSFFIGLPKQYKFGSINVVLGLDSKKDTTLRRISTVDSITYYNYYKGILSEHYVNNNIVYRPGDLASPAKQVETIRRLYRTNLFESPTITLDSVSGERVYTTLSLWMLPKYEISIRPQIDNRYLESFFMSVSASFSNINLFGNGESFRIGIVGGGQLSSVTFSSLGDVRIVPYSVDISTDITIPFFITDVNQLKIALRFAINNVYVTTLNTYGGIVQAAFYPFSFLQVNLSLFEVEVVNANNFQNFQITSISQIDGQGLKLYRPDLNLHTFFRVDFFVSNIYNREKTVSFRMNFSIEESGILAYLLDQYIIERNRQGYLFNVPYWQYFKLWGSASVAFKLSKHVFFKFKLSGGYLVPYGLSSETPFYKRFYIGGPNSLRGWSYNSVGPGNYQGGGENSGLEGGEIIFNTSLELSRYFIRSSNFGIGIAIFSDLGNTWKNTGQHSFQNDGFDALAFDAGVGLRVLTLIGVFHLDLAYPIRSPNTKTRWAQRFDISKAVFSLNITVSDFF